MFKGPEGPLSQRTPRKRAEEMNKSGNFEDPSKNYDTAGGHPTGDGMPPAQEYRERDDKPLVSETGGKNYDPNPFAVK